MNEWHGPGVHEHHTYVDAPPAAEFYAFTAPRTWVAGEVVTATIMNLHVRDNIAYLHGDAGTIILAPSSRLQISPSAGNVAELGLIDATPAAPTPGKFIRSGVGALEIVNSAYTAVIARITDAGEILGGGGTGGGGLMRAHRHPFTSPRHIEGGGFTASVATATRSSSSVTFTDAFASAAVNIALGCTNASDPTGVNTPGLTPVVCWYQGRSATGVTLWVGNGSNSNPSTVGVDYCAEYAD